MRRSAFFVLFALALLAALAYLPSSCGDDDDSSDDAGDDAGDDTGADDTGGDDTGGNPFADAEANPGQWAWIPVDGALCRDGSAAGFAVRLQTGADKVMIFMQGGGACYDVSSCGDNPSHFGAADLADIADTNLVAGIFNPTNDANPVKDWNVAYIPYCTGDLFAGNAPDGYVSGVGAQKFVGHPNVAAFLGLLAPYFADSSKVFLAGESAGGFGSFLNYAQVADAFPTKGVVLLDDSGPILSDDAALSPCYQLLVRYLWNADPSIPAGCTDCLQVNGDGMSNLHTYLATTYPNGTFGLFSALQDQTIRNFFGLGQDNCNGTTPIPGDVFSQALFDLRNQVLVPTGKWGTYYILGDTHTAVPDETMFYATSVGDATLTGWVAGLINGTIAQVAPVK